MHESDRNSENLQKKRYKEANKKGNKWGSLPELIVTKDGITWDLMFFSMFLIPV